MENNPPRLKPRVISLKGKTFNVEDEVKVIENLIKELKEESSKVQDDLLDFFKFMLNYEHKAVSMGIYNNPDTEDIRIQEAKNEFQSEYNLLSVMLAERTIHTELSLTISKLMSVEMQDYLTEEARQGKLGSAKRAIGRIATICKLKREDPRILLKVQELQTWVNHLEEQ